MSTPTTANGRSKPRGTKAAAAAAKPTRERRDDVTLDLDSLEREDKRDPFTFMHQGHVYEITDPREMDWQVQMRAFGDPIFFLRHAMSEPDVELFMKSTMPAWKLDKILEAWRSHFGLPSLGE